MTTPNIMLQKINTINNKSGILSSQANLKSGSSFEVIMDSSLKTNKDQKHNNSTVNERKSSTLTKKQNGNKKDYSDKKTENKSSDKSNHTLAKAKPDNVVDRGSQEATLKSTSKVNSSNKDEITADNAILVQIMGMLHNMKEDIAALLHINSEDLEQLLIDQDKNILDLLDVDTLKHLVLITNDETDISAFLTNENLTDKLNDLINSISHSLDEANMPMSKEELKNLLDQIQSQDINSIELMMNQSKELVNPKTEMTKVSNLMEQDDETTIKGNSFKEVNIEVTKLTDMDSSKSSLSQDEGKNEKNSDLKASEQYNIFLDNLSGAAKEIKVEFADNMVQVTELREIANQIIERIKVIIKPDQTSMELQLNPENLGKVNLSVQSKDGVLTANFVVQNQVAKEAIESQIQNLKETLGQQGIKVEAIEVTVATYDFGQNSHAGKEEHSHSKEQNHKKTLSLDEINSMDNAAADVNDVSDLTGMTGNQINYRA